jgi:two-component system, cell cycle response regulator DivK
MFSEDSKLINFQKKSNLSNESIEFMNEPMPRKEKVTTPQMHDQNSTPDWADYLILIAEDEETNFLYLKTALSPTNINIIRAKNGKEAVEQVRINPLIHIILMDIKMPEMNGLEATRGIKSFRKDVPIIAQTAFAMEEDRRNCSAVGCDDFLAKPIRYKVLLETLSKYLK